MIWGEHVHKAFEDRMADGVVLPPDLRVHEPILQTLEQLPGEQFTERKIALNRRLEPCGFFANDVWFRGVIDYTKVDDDHAVIVDYKTGRAHSKFQQLQLFALHTFILYPEVHSVEARFYWTKTSQWSDEMYRRHETSAMWARFVPDLKQYSEAFKMGVWQKRQSGLCNGWCPVTDCEFWKPRRK